MEDEQLDKQDLLWVLNEVRQLLARTVELLGTDYLPADLIDQYRAAWRDVDSLFEDVLDDVRGDTYDDDLRKHGLIGPNMELKRKGFAGAVRRFFVRPSRWALRRAFGWADVVLESLAAAIPPAALITEFKGAVEQGLADAEEPEP